ncbi:deleted in lung and esophageal cancer protein 1 isoform X10 [Canis lupus familiaris]|uniref:deleted in lung and esophageal cancer protein 1 isoform X10 n=1 Tax=Canis lupus familiaris TaxID=9615 RepID=UPI0018F29FBF|nr:deleted in lung and esophageal cancer protein 1 isoform X10 [Canis lupus familiaris]XP_038426366.1 deleted in lung and esophageal cancer protein 1 isoform X10 [Canis lupus familiaris]
METGGAEAPQSGESGSCALGAATWTPASRVARGRSPSEATRLPSLAYSEAFHYGFGSRARRVGPPTPQPLPEPHLLRLRPTSLRTQDVSHLLTGVFRNLYTDEVVGADLSASLIKARGGEDARHEEFVDELRRIREVYKQRLDEVEMLERHIIQARARALAEKERIMQQAKVHVLENFITVPPVKSIFRWCVDSELLQKHHLISPDDYYSDTVPFCSAPKGVSIPGYSKLTFSCEKHSVPKKHLTKKLEASCEEMLTKVKDELDYTVDSQTGDLSLKGKCKTVKAGPSKNAKWMSHLHVPQRELERLLLVRMESRNRFLKNPRFFPPNTPQGGKSLLFPPKKPMLTGDFPSGDLEESCVDTPVFLAKPSIGFFTDYEIGPVYEMVISLQNTTATSRYLRVIPPSTPYFALGLGMFPGKGGMVAPGMTCQYTVQFFPDCLGDFDDFILVETQSAHTLLIPLQARRPPPVLTLSPVLDCGYCLIGGMKITRFICKNVGFSVGKFCIMPKKSWPPPSFRAVATIGFVEQPPFGILPSVFELAPGQAVCMEVLFLPTSLEKAEQTFIVVCDNCQIKELVTVGIGQLVALDLIYISGEESHPEPGELTDLTAQHFIRFEPENLQSTARKQLIIRNATHVELAFHWQIMKPNLQSLMPGETYSLDSLKYHPDRETAFSILPERGVLGPHTDHEFILTFSPHELRDFHSVLQMVLEEVPEPLSLELENLKDSSFSVDDVIVLEIEVKGSVEPFQLLLEPYALIIPGENYVGINVKKDFKMWNNSKSPIRYLWGKISDCHIIEVEPCAGTIEPNEVEDFELSFTGGVPGPVSQDLLCEIQNSPSPVVLHIEAAFKGPALVISVSALQFGLLRLGQKATNSIQIQNISQLPATWCMKESPVCLQERHEDVSPFDIEPSSGQIHPLGECRVNITLEAKQCQRLQTVLELEVVNGTWSYLPVYAEVQEPYVYLQSSHVEVRNLYLGVPAKATITLINGTLLPTRFHWSKLLGHQASVCTAKVSPRRGTLGPSEERQLNLELTAHTEEELSDLALPCTVSGMKEPLVLGISGKPQGLQVAIAISMEGSDSSTALWPGHLEELRLDFGSKVPLRTRMNCQLILTNHSPIQTPFTLKFEYFGSPQNSLNQKPSLPNMPPALLKTSRIREHLAKREQLNFMESMLSHGKGAAFFPHISQGTLGAHQQLSIDITGYANMWGEYWDNLICTVGDLPPAVIPVHMAVVGCPISSQRTTYYTTDQLQKEPIIRFGTQVSGGDTVTRVLRLNNSSPCDIRLDWETYTPEDREDRLLELLVFYGPPFPLRDQAGNDLSCPETPESSSSFWSSSPSNTSDSSHEAAQSAEGSDRASQKIISVVLREHDGVPADHLYCVSPKQVVVPTGGSSTISISYTPMVLGPEVLHKVKCVGYALGFMSLDDEAERELPGRRHRLQDFAAGPLRLDLCGYVRPAQLSMELDYGGGVEFRHQASDLIPEQPCTGVLSELVTTHHLKLTNTTEIPQYFQLLVSRPFSVSQEGASRSRRAPGPGREEEPATASKQLVLHPQENMLVNVSFSLSLELLSYQKLPADQMLPGVDIRQHASGEKEMVFTQSLLLEYANHTTQVVPLRATVAVPELQLSTSWVDFGTCFVNQERVREVYLMNLSGCRSYWAVLMGQQDPDKDLAAFRVSPNSGLLEARLVNAPPNTITLQVFFTARSSELYESTLVVEGMLGEKACTLRLRGRGSYDERYMSPHQL